MRIHSNTSSPTPAATSPLDTIDYCGSICGNAVTQYADGKCLCCGRDWGEENGTCRGRHIEGDVWWRLLDVQDDPETPCIA